MALVISTLQIGTDACRTPKLWSAGLAFLLDLSTNKTRTLGVSVLTSDQWTLTDLSPVSVEYRRVELLSNSSQVSGTTEGAATQKSVGLQVFLSTRNVALQFGTDVPPSATITFPGPNPGGPPNARSVPFEHRCPDGLRAFVTPNGDTRHTSHNCADQRTRGLVRAFRPCRMCTTGYTFPQLL